MKNIFLATLLILLAGSANAGFLLGYAVGSTSAKGKAQPVGESGQLLASDLHDVIICARASTGQNRCEEVIYQGRMVPMTPAEYATYSGYKLLHKVGAFISAGKPFIVMEVSR